MTTVTEPSNALPEDPPPASSAAVSAVSRAAAKPSPAIQAACRAADRIKTLAARGEL